MRNPGLPIKNPDIDLLSRSQTEVFRLIVHMAFGKPWFVSETTDSKIKTNDSKLQDLFFSGNP